jgi:hypothetical protein
VKTSEMGTLSPLDDDDDDVDVDAQDDFIPFA